MTYRRLKEKIAIMLTALASTIVSLMFIIIMGIIAIKAVPSLSLDFILTTEFAAEGFGNGIANAIAGTVLLSICSVSLASPIAIGTAIYMSKYEENQMATGVLRFFIDLLSGTPSIVLGVFGLLILVVYLKPLTGGFSLLSGSIALAILIMPVIERAAEEAISAVPSSLEDASYALGATRWATVRAIVIPYAMSGIVTGVILGVGRAAEESAVVILTAGYSQFLPDFSVHKNAQLLFGIQIEPFQNVAGSLPATVYHAYEMGNLMPMSNGFASAFVLIIIVLLINMAARLVLWRWRLK